MKYVVLIIIMFFSVDPTEIHAQRGCCSHHGGVAGCSSNGRQICNDGTLSPSCTCTPVVQTIYGCTDPKAKNYDKNANKDNDSCEYYVYGCTDPEAKNYNVNADKDDNTCEYYVYGCTDSEAENYDEEAEKNDDSCIYDEKENKKISKDEKQVIKIDEQKEFEDTENNSQNDDGSTLFGIGIVALAVYLYKRKKNKK